MHNWYPFEENKVEIMREAYRMRPTRILELGAYIGIDSIVLSLLCKEIVCIEGRDEQTEELRLRLLSFGLKASVYCENVESFAIGGLGTFDLVWASGILYHLKNPRVVIARIAGVSPVCLGWTHIAVNGESVHDRYMGQWQCEDVSKPLAGLDQKSFWMTKDEFARAWSECGMEFRWLTDVLPHPNGGLSGQFIATRKQ